MAQTIQDAYDLLKKLNIHATHVEHPAITSVKNVPFDLPGPQVKNLVLKSKKEKEIYYLILPDEKQADLKTLAKVIEVSRLSFVSEQTLQKLLKVSAGSVTPFALINDVEHQVNIIIDSSIDRQDTVGFHPNINTVTSIIQYKDFEKVLDYLGYTPRYILL